MIILHRKIWKLHEVGFEPDTLSDSDVEKRKGRRIAV